jgi:hypothetical protein
MPSAVALAAGCRLAECAPSTCNTCPHASRVSCQRDCSHRKMSETEHLCKTNGLVWA